MMRWLRWRFSDLHSRAITGRVRQTTRNAWEGIKFCRMVGVGQAKFAGVTTLFDPIARRAPRSDWGRADGMVIADQLMF